jgi:hypothetical protein
MLRKPFLHRQKPFLPRQSYLRVLRKKVKHEDEVADKNKRKDNAAVKNMSQCTNCEGHEATI